MVSIALVFDHSNEFNLSIDAPKKTEGKASAYRQWKIDDLTDDDEEEPSKNHSTQIKSNAFERFIAQRPTSMPPPVLIPAEPNKPSPITDIINLTHENKTTRTRVRRPRTRTRRRDSRKSFSQNPRSSPLLPILSPTVASSQTPTIIDITDDADDFI